MEIDRFSTAEELEARLAEIKERVGSLDAEFGVKAFTEEARAEWDDLNEEHELIEARLEEIATRKARVLDLAKRKDTIEVGDSSGMSAKAMRKPEYTFDLAQIRMDSGTQEEFLGKLRDNAMHVVEQEKYFPAVDRRANPGLKLRNQQVAKLSREDIQDHIGYLLDTVDAPDPESNKEPGELARRIVATGSPLYRKAFFKRLTERPLTPEEQRALSVGTGSAGGFAVVYTLDPTIVPTSNYSVNPFRAMSRVETISGTNEWKAVTSGAITFAFGAEAAEASDNAPTLAQPDIIVEKAQGYVPFSLEIGQDWGALESEMAQLFADGKDDVEALKFTTGAGHGSTEPKGIVTAATNTVATATTQAFVIGDLYSLIEAVPPRFRPRMQFMSNLFIINKIRQFDTSGGSGVWIGPEGLQAKAGGGQAGAVTQPVEIPLFGRAFWENSVMDGVLTTGSEIIVAGDWRYFVIVDRIGMNVELLPLVVGTNHRPTGQRGLYAYFRTSSDVMSAAAFRVLRT